MIVETDTNGHSFVTVGNVRITYLPQSSWAEGSSLRIQAYQNDKNYSLFPGPEFSVENADDLIDAIRLLTRRDEAAIS